MAAARLQLVTVEQTPGYMSSLAVCGATPSHTPNVTRSGYQVTLRGRLNSFYASLLTNIYKLYADENITSLAEVIT